MSNRGAYRQGPGGSRAGAVQIIIDGQGSVIPTGLYAGFPVPYDCVIEECLLESAAGGAGSVTIDLYRLNRSEWLAALTPAAGNSIVSQDKPLLSSASRAVATMSGWDRLLMKDDVLYVNVDSAATITRLVLSLLVRRVLA